MQLLRDSRPHPAGFMFELISGERQRLTTVPKQTRSIAQTDQWLQIFNLDLRLEGETLGTFMVAQSRENRE